MAKENQTETQDDVTVEVMPGADPVSEEEAGKDFKVDMNFETEETQEEEEVEEQTEPETEEEPSEGTEEVAEEEEAEDDVEGTEDSGEETVLEDDAGDTQESVEPVQEEPEEPKEPMIPKSRFDEVLAKQKALQKKLDEALAPQIEKVEQAPDFDFEAKELEYQEMILNGEAKQAAQLRADIRAAEKQTMMFEVQSQMGQTVQQSTESMQLQQKAAEIAEQYDILNESSPKYDEVKTQEVLDLRDAYILQGRTGAEALQKAVDLLMPTSIDPAPINEPETLEIRFLLK